MLAIVVCLQIVYDKVTDRSRGFGFVTMGSIEEAKEAIQMFNSSVSFHRFCFPFDQLQECFSISCVYACLFHLVANWWKNSESELPGGAKRRRERSNENQDP